MNYTMLTQCSDDIFKFASFQEEQPIEVEIVTRTADSAAETAMSIEPPCSSPPASQQSIFEQESIVEPQADEKGALFKSPTRPDSPSSATLSAPLDSTVGSQLAAPAKPLLGSLSPASLSLSGSTPPRSIYRLYL